MVQEFLETGLSGISESDHENFARVWKRAEAWELERGKRFDSELSKDDYLDFMEFSNVRKYSTFVNYKRLLMYYVRFLADEGLVPVEQPEVLASIQPSQVDITKSDKIYYFRDIQHLYKAVKETLDAIDVPDPIENPYFAHTSAIFLAWYGATMDEISSFQKSDVLDAEILLHGEKIPVPYQVLKQLKTYKQMNAYLQYGGNGCIIRRPYENSKFLLRSFHTERMNYKAIKNLFYRFNNILDCKYNLRYEIVWQSGVFFRVMQQEKQDPWIQLRNPEIATKLFCTDLSSPSKLTRWLKDYEQYKTLMLG